MEEGFVILLPDFSISEVSSWNDNSFFKPFVYRLQLQSQISWGQTNLRKIFLKLKNGEIFAWTTKARFFARLRLIKTYLNWTIKHQVQKNQNKAAFVTLFRTMMKISSYLTIQMTMQWQLNYWMQKYQAKIPEKVTKGRKNQKRLIVRAATSLSRSLMKVKFSQEATLTSALIVTRDSSRLATQICMKGHIRVIRNTFAAIVRRSSTSCHI